MLSKTKSFSVVHILLLFVVLHLLLLNINAAEWGDSYRILEAAQSLQSGSYPADEKRPPLFSILLAVKPSSVDFVTWGRVVMFGLSLIFFLVLYKYLKTLLLSNRALKLVLLLFTLNPVLLYWSIRIMADVPFALLALTSFYFLKKGTNPIFVGLLAGLGVLTRFEGYILGFALGLDLLLNRDFKKLGLYALGALAIVVPYWIWRNPLTSSYFEEPAGRVYDFKMLGIYFASLIFIAGTVYLPYFVVSGRRYFSEFFSNNRALTIFVILELLLIVAWPAAVPRLFVAILMYFLIPLGQSMADIKNKNVVLLASGLALFALVQYIIRLQFLVADSMWLLAVLGIQLCAGIALLLDYKKYFYALTFVGMLVWSLGVIASQKDVFKPTKNAAEYLAKNLSGTVAYNDVSSVSGWYLPAGFYYNTDVAENKTKSELEARGIDYLLVTNEHNPTMVFDIESRDYLELVKEFRYNIQGTDFWARIVKVKHES